MSIRASNVQLLGVGAPLDRGTSRLRGMFISFFWHFRVLAKNTKFFLLHDIINLDFVISSGSKPHEVSIEVKSVDFGVGFQVLVRLAKIIIIPDSDVLIFTSGGNILTISRDSQSVDVVIVSFDGGVELEDTGPDFKSSVSSDRGVVVVLSGLRVSDLADPAKMVVVLGFDLALAESVPDEEVLLGTAGEDLSVVARESNTVDFLVVSDESLKASGVSDIPESEGLVP